MAKTKMTKDIVPQDFTLPLVFVDALPVLLFGVTMITAGLLLRSAVFIIGAALCLLGGAGKVLWKLIVVLEKKNVWWLFVQMRIVMPLGFLVMLAGLAAASRGADMHAALAAVTGLPQLVFFLLGILGMILMMVFAKKLDSSDVRANWIEQLTNAAAQACFLAGLLSLLAE